MTITNGLPYFYLFTILKMQLLQCMVRFNVIHVLNYDVHINTCTKSINRTIRILRARVPEQLYIGHVDYQSKTRRKLYILCHDLMLFIQTSYIFKLVFTYIVGS